MAYLPKTIREVVLEMNIKYFLPHIQRELVWKPHQIKRLFDSLMRGYPISTFLFWKITNNKNEVTKLEFIKNFERDSKNEINSDTERDEYWLVLDGQQRLQSFFIALKGSFNEREFFFNALSKKPLEDEEEDESEIIYETNFFKKKNSSFIKEEEDNKTKEKIKKLWVKIKDFGLLEGDKIYEFIQQIKENYGKIITLKESNLLDQNLQKLNNKISNVSNIYYFLEEKEDYNRVLDIFIRTNSGGTILSKSDLLFSIIKLKWENLDAYREFKDLIRDINRKGDFEFDNDFILKTSLVLINKDIKYRVENFKEKNVREIENNWKRIKESIKIVIDLLINDFGINSKKQLTSKNSIIPIINYTFLNNIKTYQSNKKEISSSKKLMKKWLFSVLLTNLFSGQTDELLKRFREVIIKSKGSIFPLKELNANLPPGKRMDIKKEDFDKISYGKGPYFFVLGLLYPYIDLNPSSERNKPHIDHMFPETLLEGKYENELIHSIGNLQFLTATENESKNKTPFEDWIKSLDKEFIEKSYIPEDNRLWNIKNYTHFLEKRKEKLFKRLKKILED